MNKVQITVLDIVSNENGDLDKVSNENGDHILYSQTSVFERL